MLSHSSDDHTSVTPQTTVQTIEMPPVRPATTGSFDERSIADSATSHAPAQSIGPLPYHPAHQIELLSLHAEVDALLQQLNAAGQSCNLSCDLMPRSGKHH